MDIYNNTNLDQSNKIPPSIHTSSVPKMVLFLCFFFLLVVIAGSSVYFFGIELTKVTTQKHSIASEKQAPIQDNFVLLDTKEKLASDLNVDLQKGMKTTIPGTDLVFTKPATYQSVNQQYERGYLPKPVISFYKPVSKIVSDVFDCMQLPTDPVNHVTPPAYLTESYCKPLLDKYEKTVFPDSMGIEANGIDIVIVKTSLTPREWAAQNIVMQGVAWKDDGTNGQDIQINGNTFFSMELGCCGSYKRAYIFPYMNLAGDRILVFFTTSDPFGDDPSNSRNIILDKILSTLKAKHAPSPSPNVQNGIYIVSLTGTVFSDTNCSQVFSSQKSVLANIRVDIYAKPGNKLLSSMQTSTSGRYVYTTSVPEGTSLTIQPVAQSIAGYQSYPKFNPSFGTTTVSKQSPRAVVNLPLLPQSALSYCH